MDRLNDQPATPKPRETPRYGLLALSLVGLGVIAAAAPSGCHDHGCDDAATASADAERCGER